MYLWQKILCHKVVAIGISLKAHSDKNIKLSQNDHLSDNL